MIDNRPASERAPKGIGLCTASTCAAFVHEKYRLELLFTFGFSLHWIELCKANPKEGIGMRSLRQYIL